MIHILKSRKKTLALILITALILGRFIIHHHANNLPATQSAVMVDADKVKQGSIAIEAQAIGTLVAAKNIQITPEIPGHISKIFFEDGGVSVKRGTPLIQLDDATFKAKLQSDKANLLYSETDYKRKVLLGKLGAISQQAIDQALADLATKKAVLEQSQVDVNKMLLVAPFDGVIGKINVSPGDYVTATQSLVSLTDIQHLHVEYSVSEKYLPQLKIGQKIKITSSTFPGREFTGNVAFISPTINNSDRTIALYAEVANDKHELTSGLFVNVLQELGAENNALLVPAASLVPTIDGQQIYKIVDNKATAVKVLLGQRVQNTVEIISGLSLGDTVVVNGQQKLKDGIPVQINQSGNKA
ncbi:MAG: efflux RND transporter periplasmic adaptor subunit [Gammaproteobacteria bacterium]